MAELPIDGSAVLPCVMKMLKPYECGMDAALRRLKQILDEAEIIAYPTETFYGLGVKYNQESGLERLYQIKQRPLDKGMPLIIGRPELLSLLTPAISPAARRLMKIFWPGPLTLIFQAREALSLHITAGTGKVAVRIPGPSFALDLARQTDYPITSTSANIAGMPPSETAAQVIDYFGSSSITIVDAGRTPGGAPSTIVDVTGAGAAIIRQGVISAEAVSAAAQL